MPGGTRNGRYYRARYYHPGLQRFISEDPIGFSGGDINLYAYVLNEPTSFRDSTGLAVDPISWTAAAIMCGSGAVVGAVMAGRKATWTARLHYAGLGCGVGMLTLVSGIAAVGAGALGAVGLDVAGSGVATGAAVGLQVGTNLGKIGTVVENPGVKIRALDPGFHFITRVMERGVSPQAITNTMRSPVVVLEQSGGRYLYLGTEAGVVVTRNGTAITAYGRDQFNREVLGILRAAGAMP